MFACEQIAAVFRWELRPVVEGQPERGTVRLQQNVGDYYRIDGLVGGPGQFRSWIFVLADIEPGPAIEAVFLNRRDVIGDEIVAQVVALVDGAPDFTGRRVNAQANRVANTRGVDLDEFSFRRVFENVGAMFL